MKIFTFSIPLILLFIQVFLSCDCQIVPISLNGIPNFNPSSFAIKILKAADFTNYRIFQSIFSNGTSIYTSIPTNLPSVNTSDLVKTVITNSAQNDIIKVMNALNAIASSLAGCTPPTSYPNDLNISTSCFSAICSNTVTQCQALYLQLAIDELSIALNTAAYNLNFTSSILIGSGWNFPSISNLLNQWSIVEASAAAYQTSTKIGSLIGTVNSSFKRVLTAALNGASLFLNYFESGYNDLIIAVNYTDYNQTIDDYANLIALSASTSAEKSLLTDTFMFNGIILKSSSAQSSISGISATNFVRPNAIAVFDRLAALSSSFNTELTGFQSSMQSILIDQQQNFSSLVQLTASRFLPKESQQATSCFGPAKVSSVLPQQLWNNDLSPFTKSAQTETSNLIGNYTNLINSYTNMAIDCFKVGCTGNAIYPYSTWKLQCVNDFTFTSYCWSNGIPRVLQRCPSAKAQSVNACLDDVLSLISSLEPSSDMNSIVENTKLSFDLFVDNYTNTTDEALIHVSSIYPCLFKV